MIIIDRFIEHLKAGDLSSHTLRAYRSDLMKFARWYADSSGNPFRPEAVTPLDVAEFRGYLLRNNQKPATINRCLAAIAAFFAWALEAEILTYDPTRGVKKIKEVEQAPRSLERREQLALMRAVAASGNERDNALVTLLLHTGLRVGEVAALGLQDVEVNQRGGWVHVKDGKGMKARSVPLNVTARRALMRWFEKRGKEPGPLFFGKRRDRLGVRGIAYLVARYSRIAGLHGVTPHTLRHTFAKNLIDAGVSIDQVALLLGHETLDTTKRYTKASARDLENAVKTIQWE